MILGKWRYVLKEISKYLKIAFSEEWESVQGGSQVTNGFHYKLC